MVAAPARTFFMKGCHRLGSSMVELVRDNHTKRSTHTMTKGKLVGKLPPRASRGEDYDWDAAALLAAEHPDEAVLAASHVPESRVKSVRGYTRHPFVQSTGRIIVAVRNSTVEADGIRYGDVYFQWEAKEKEGA